eukprot:7010420-Alexandrium_andersonii.AAC.1
MNKTATLPLPLATIEFAPRCLIPGVAKVLDGHLAQLLALLLGLANRHPRQHQQRIPVLLEIDRQLPNLVLAHPQSRPHLRPDSIFQVDIFLAQRANLLFGAVGKDCCGVVLVIGELAVAVEVQRDCPFFRFAFRSPPCVSELGVVAVEDFRSRGPPSLILL